MKNPFSCILPSFKKYPIKNNLYNTAERSEVFGYTPQLCDRKDEANKTNESNSNKQPYVPLVDLNIKTFSEGFKPNDLLSGNEEKRLLSRSCVKKVMRFMLKIKNKSIATWIMLLDIYQTTGFLLFSIKDRTILLVQGLF